MSGLFVNIFIKDRLVIQRHFNIVIKIWNIFQFFFEINSHMFHSGFLCQWPTFELHKNFIKLKRLSPEKFVSPESYNKAHDHLLLNLMKNQDRECRLMADAGFDLLFQNNISLLLVIKYSNSGCYILRWWHPYVRAWITFQKYNWVLFLAHLVMSLCNHVLSVVVVVVGVIVGISVIIVGIGVCVQPSQWPVWS